MILHFSEEIGLSVKGHINFDFVDINVMDDQKLFIDPCLIQISHDPWCERTWKTISSFFDCFYGAYRSNNQQQKMLLLSHAGEVNCTRLGYGDGWNGHGNTAAGLIEKFTDLSVLSTKIPTISEPMDLSLMTPDFNEDGLSDMLTNIIHLQLHEFTMGQLSKYGVRPNGVDSFWTWNVEECQWSLMQDAPAYFSAKGKILLVPKVIVHKRFLFRAEHFIQHEILTRMQVEHQYVDSKGILRKPPKKEMKQKLDRTDDGWRTENVVAFAEKLPESLRRYHKRVPEFYTDRAMSDDELDELIYGK